MIRKLEYTTDNTDGHMGKSYSRSTTGTVDKIKIFTIIHEPDGDYYWIKEGFFPMAVYVGFNDRDERFGKGLRKEYKTLKKAKAKAQEMFEIYILTHF